MTHKLNDHLTILSISPPMPPIEHDSSVSRQQKIKMDDSPSAPAKLTQSAASSRPNASAQQKPTVRPTSLPRSNLFSSEFPMNIITFLRKKNMDYWSPLNLIQQEGIFLSSPQQEHESTIQHDSLNCLPYLYKGDSMKYISQFLDLIEEDQVSQTNADSSVPQTINNGPREEQARHKTDQLLKKEKKIRKTENSPFHNYQKHLNNALKKLIIVPQFTQSDGPYKKVAHEIWSTYVNSDIKTKRILHYIFNEHNQHTINQQELRTYRLYDLYQQHGEESIKRAKNYLSKLAIDQIDEQNIEGYLKTRKLKKLDGFKEYIIQFRQELSSGYLKRRLNPENLQN